LGPAAQNTVEISLSAPLLDGVIYLLTVGPVSAAFSWQDPIPDPGQSPNADDPEAEVFGVDIDWLFGDLTADGDVESIRGQRCLEEDLISVCFLNPGELAQFPDDGVGMPDRVNGPFSSAESRTLRTKIVSQWRKDDRVRDASVELTINSDLTVDLEGRVQSIAVARDLTIRNR
jgi:hypothetical protein